MKQLILILAALFISYSALAADMAVVWLKNGGKINGIITNETERGITVNIGFGTVTIASADIDKIEIIEGAGKDVMVKAMRRKNIRAVSKSDEQEQARAIRKRNAKYLTLRNKFIETAKKRKERETEYRIGFTDSSRIVVPVILNGKVKVQMLVDTGATSVFISPEIADRLKGIHATAGGRVNIAQASGAKELGTPVKLGSVKVAGLTAEDVEGIILDKIKLRGAGGLLGMSFLNRFHVRIDTQNRELVLMKK